ncbi:MAG TPA: hypothetical protein VIM11_09595 [Tepidisphaeraceae bacterium]|jgi:hypothetical protein
MIIREAVGLYNGVREYTYDAPGHQYVEVNTAYVTEIANQKASHGW